MLLRGAAVGAAVNHVAPSSSATGMINKREFWWRFQETLVHLDSYQQISCLAAAAATTYRPGGTAAAAAAPTSDY